MAKDRLINIENEIKRLIEIDKTDPKVFEKIQELVYKFLLRNKVFPNYDIAKEVSYTISEYMYMKTLDDTKNPICAWIGYINKIYPSYVREYYNKQTEIIDTSGNRDLETAVVRMISGSTMDDDSINQIYARDYIKSVPKIIEEILDRSHFYRYTPEYLNARVSLLLSVVNDKFVGYNLNEVDAAYTKLLYKVLCSRLVNEMRSDEQEHFGLVQFFLLDCNNDRDYEGGFDKWSY